MNLWILLSLISFWMAVIFGVVAFGWWWTLLGTLVLLALLLISLWIWIGAKENAIPSTGSD